MLTQGEDVEAHALKERGWSISAIARHLEPGPQDGPRLPERRPQPGVRVSRRAGSAGRRSWPTCRARFVDDPHLWATALFDEVVAARLCR